MSSAEPGAEQGIPPDTRVTSLIWGAGGLAGAELLRLISTHPNLRLTGALSRSLANRPVTEVYPSLVSLAGVEFCHPDHWDWNLLPGPAVIFAAMAHGETMQVLPAQLSVFEQKGFRVVDLSGDFRLSTASAYRTHYRRDHVAENWLSGFVYGLPELQRTQIRSADRVANPGCFATGAQLAFLPLAGAGWPVHALAIDGKTGSSGAGLKPGLTTHHPLRANNCEAYKLDGHPHLGEIQAGWILAGGTPETEISFVPQRTPMVRGIYTTVHAFLEEPISTAEARQLFRRHYSSSPLVRLVDQPPSMNGVAGTARCDLSVHARGKHLVICSAIDNLLKGAASQAIQNVNLMFGWPEVTGLELPPPWPA